MTHRLPRLGFLGVGWIGRDRLAAAAQSGLAEVAAVCDPVEENAVAASRAAQCSRCSTLDQLLDAGLDGLVIATPSALHAEQAIATLRKGIAVFCQKPLGRTLAETARVVATARSHDALLGVDLSYRHVNGVAHIRELIRSGALGTVYAADLVFHNAFGPDKPWFYDPGLSGGGCVIDLGTHLVDLALHLLEPAVVTGVSSRLFARGARLTLPTAAVVEDYATAELELDNGITVRLACSWNLSAGCDAVIEVAIYGTHGGARLGNVGGSFYDFRAESFRGTARQTLAEPPDAWGGRAVVEWVRRLRSSPGFDPRAEELTDVAAVIDAIYGRRDPITLTSALPEIGASAILVGSASDP